MTTLQTTAQEIIEFLKPDEILVNSSNYLQCIINGSFCEFQKCYIKKRWCQFKTTGRSDSPKEAILRYL